jgi:hypothetical protein
MLVSKERNLLKGAATGLLVHIQNQKSSKKEAEEKEIR